MTPWSIYLAIGILATMILLLVGQINKRTRPADSADFSSRILQNHQKGLLENLFYKAVLPVLVFTMMILIWPVAVPYLMWTALKKNTTIDEWHDGSPAKAFEVRREHLVVELTLDEVEKRERVYDPLGMVPDLPFGFLNDRWVLFMSEIESTDEIWSFSARWSGDWRDDLRQGYALIRDGAIVKSFTTEITDA